MKQNKDGIQGTAVAPQGTAVAPQGTAVAPQGTAVVAQGTAVAPQGTSVASSDIASEQVVTTGKVVSSGSEAEIITTRFEGRECAMRLFRPGFGPNDEVNNALRKLYGKGYITEILDSGTRDGRKYEIMPFYPHGSVADYDLRGKDTEILTIAIKTAMSLDAMHKAHVMHKDIKPANILLTDPNSLDTVICDFGIADIISGGKVVTKQVRTPVYAAPELYDPKNVVARLDGEDLFEITPAADFYSLGMTILCLWYGEKAFLKKEQQMAVDKLKNGIRVPDDMPETLAVMARGLLQQNPRKRWGFKEIRDMLVPEALGEYGVRLFLNPLYDMRLNPDPGSPDYIATGEQMGKFLNDVYLWYFTGAKAPADEKLCDLVLDSFESYEDSYLATYFDSKGDFFKNYAEWVEKCIDHNFEGDKIATSDPHQRFQICMMKTIKGLGYKPVYRFRDTGELVSDIDGLNKAKGDRKKALEDDGLRGWLAVQFQEDPFADFSGYFAYEDALLGYVQALLDCDPDVTEGNAFAYACDGQEAAARKVKRSITGKIIRRVLQWILPLVAMAISAYVTRSFVDIALVDPAVSDSILQHKWIFYVIGVVAGIIVLSAAGSFLAGFLTFGGVSFLSLVLSKLAVDNMMWVLAGLAAAVGIFAFVILVIALWPCSDAMYPSKVRTDDDEAILECLDYVFNDAKDFDSSLNGFLTDGRMYRWKERLDRNRKRLIVCFCCLAVAVAASFFLTGTSENDTTADETIEEVQ